MTMTLFWQYDPAVEKAVPKDAIVIENWAPGPRHLAGLLDLLRENYWRELADQIEAQARPAITEPTGLGAVVEDVTGERWVRLGGKDEYPHVWDTPTKTTSWAQIKPARVLSEGVTE